MSSKENLSLFLKRIKEGTRRFKDSLGQKITEGSERITEDDWMILEKQAARSGNRLPIDFKSGTIRD